jgi:hypothetical protein
MCALHINRHCGDNKYRNMGLKEVPYWRAYHIRSDDGREDVYYIPPGLMFKRFDLAFETRISDALEFDYATGPLFDDERKRALLGYCPISPNDISDADARAFAVYMRDPDHEEPATADNIARLLRTYFHQFTRRPEPPETESEPIVYHFYGNRYAARHKSDRGKSKRGSDINIKRWTPSFGGSTRDETVEHEPYTVDEEDHYNDVRVRRAVSLRDV